MGNSNTRSFGTLAIAYKTLVEGLQTDWPASQTSIVVGQTTYTIAQFIQKVKDEMAPLQAVTDARVVLTTALQNRAVALPGIESFLVSVYAVLPQYLGATADLTKFGKKPAKVRAPLTAEKKAEAAAKRAATRAARHTMGKNQKKAVKGQVPPAPAPAAPPKGP